MTALEQAILRAAIIQAGSTSQGQIADVLIGLILADQPTRDAFIKQSASAAVQPLQDQLANIDKETADRKIALAADVDALAAVATAVVDSPLADPAVIATP